LLQIKLREFLQKNFKALPLNTFEEIENIISPPDLTGDLFGIKNA
jgi:hypothetical protein